MLVHIFIKNLAIVEQLELNFYDGLSILTGETGAGKSILVDALQLILGEPAPAPSSMVRHQCSHAEVSAVFELQALPQVVDWLVEQDLNSENECIIRRTITHEGRSRAYINGRTVPVAQLRQLGEQLINIQGQHQHQTLLKTDHQRALLDEYAGHHELTQQVRQAYLLLQKLRKEYQTLANLEGKEDKLALLQYQIQEMEELNVQENEFKNLENEQKELAHAEQWLLNCETALNYLKNESEENSDAFSAIYQAINQINSLKSQTSKLDTCHELLNNALIQLEEGSVELENFKATLNLDPERLKAVNERLSQLYALARKHRIQPEEILTYKQILSKEAITLLDLQATLKTLSEKVQAAQISYANSAKLLSESRKKAALQLEPLIVGSLKMLEMPHAQFKIAFTNKNDESPNPHGMDSLEFLVSMNLGIPPQPLRKIASGGELSRISLAIQVITTQKVKTPTLVFDEVDTGISGKTAETVGKLLRKLSLKTQVFCITHLAQIAAQGQHHYKVEKLQTKASTTSCIHTLDKPEKIQEIARLLGGATITQHALLHAEAMLDSV